MSLATDVLKLTEATSYALYHKTYSAAVQALITYAQKKGYEVSEEDIFQNITTGPGKPSEGNTHSFHLGLSKKGKEQKVMLHGQVFGMKNSYELNGYIA